MINSDEIPRELVNVFQKKLIEILKRQGYKNKGLTAFKECEDVAVILTIQNEDRWQYINVGIQFLKFENKIPEKAYKAHLRFRLEDLVKGFEKEIWELADKKKISATASKFLDCFQKKIVQDLDVFFDESLVKKYFNEKYWDAVLSTPEVRSYLSSE
jgi:Domain of unknown function (DUF4304)